MPLLWNSQEDIFIGMLAPPCFFLHLTKKLDMSYSEINHNFLYWFNPDNRIPRRSSANEKEIKPFSSRGNSVS